MKLKSAFGALLAGVFLAGTAQAVDITGAGATFPYPIYAKWADAYKKATGVGMNYQSIGSGGGIKQITAKTVDFGASDAPMKGEDLDKNGLIQFPAIMGGVVPVYNLKGVTAGRAQADRSAASPTSTSARSRCGTIRRSSNSIRASTCPDQAISAVNRSDGSGTTFLFTNYLSKVSPEWKSTIGEGTAVKWSDRRGRQGQRGRGQLRAAASTARSATSSTPTPSRTSCRTR